MVPFLDLGAAYQELKGEIDAAVAKVLASGWYIGGDTVSEFEAAFAAYTETPYCVGVGNGLDALKLALKALGVSTGDEVIVPSHTYIASWLAISELGAVPVPVEPDPQSYNLDAKKIEAAITNRTKAIMPVHLYGQPANLDAIVAVAKAHGLYVVEDAAQAHGARYKGRRIGGQGDVACWSFYPGKNLGAMGDGGAITTENAELAEKIRLLGNYGSHRKYIHKLQGMNSRLDPLQAAILQVKLAYLDEWNQRRRKIANAYHQALASVAGLTLPQVPDWAESVWHLYVVRCVQRDALQEKLQRAEIQTLIHYPTPPHKQQAYNSYAGQSQPIAEQLSQEILSLPIGPQMPMKHVEHICEVIAS